MRRRGHLFRHAGKGTAQGHPVRHGCPRSPPQQGWGRRLVCAALECAASRAGVRQVRLTVTEGNTGAQRLHEGCGFSAFGLEPEAVEAGGSYLGKVRMWRSSTFSIIAHDEPNFEGRRVTYRLHGFCQSGNTYKVALLLQVLKQPWQPEFVDFMNGVTRTGAWREAANEMGEVPVLDDGSRRLTQSGVILTYLARKHGAYGGRTEDEELEVLRWILFDNHKFTSYFATCRFMKAFGPAQPDPAVMAWLRGRLDNAFGIVDAHLKTRAFMVSDEPTIADVSLCGYLFFPVEESGYEVAGRFPSIQDWLQRMRDLPGWADPYDLLPGERIAPKW